MIFADLSIDVNKLTTEQMHEVNKCALHYGLGRQDFMSLLTRDLDEQESLRIAKEEEQERAMYSVINIAKKSILVSNNYKKNLREEKQGKNGERLESKSCKLCLRIDVSVLQGKIFRDIFEEFTFLFNYRFDIIFFTTLVTLHELVQLMTENFSALNQCRSHAHLHLSKGESSLSLLSVMKIRTQEKN